MRKEHLSIVSEFVQGLDPVKSGKIKVIVCEHYVEYMPTDTKMKKKDRKYIGGIIDVVAYFLSFLDYTGYTIVKKVKNDKV